MIGLSLVYALGLLIFAAPLEKFIYDGKFFSYVWLIPLLGLPPFLIAIETGYSLVNRSLQHPIYYGIQTGSMALAGIISGPIMIKSWGLLGAFYSLIFVSAISLLVNLGYYIAWFPKANKKGAKGTRLQN